MHDRLPLPAGTRDGDYAVHTVAGPTGAGDEVRPGTIGQFHGSRCYAGDRHARSEVGGEIFDGIVDFVRPDLRTAQDHVVNLPPPAGLAHARIAVGPVRIFVPYRLPIVQGHATNMPAMKIDSAVRPFRLPVVWNDSSGVSEKQLRFRQSFQSARPMSGSPCGPRFAVT